MDEFIKAFQDTYGLIGLLIAVPIAAMVVMWKHNVRQNAKMVKQAEDYSRAVQGFQDKINEVHQKRVEDAQAVSSKLMEMAKESSALNKETAIALDRVSDMLAVLTHGKGK